VASPSQPQYEQPYGHEAGQGQFEEAYKAVLDPFWAAQKQEISQASTDLSEYKSQQLPLARIKKVSWCCDFGDMKHQYVDCPQAYL